MKTVIKQFQLIELSQKPMEWKKKIVKWKRIREKRSDFQTNQKSLKGRDWKQMCNQRNTVRIITQ